MNTLELNRWENSTVVVVVVVVEVQIILNIVKTVYEATNYLNRGRVVFYNNNKQLIKKLDMGSKEL